MSIICIKIAKTLKFYTYIHSRSLIENFYWSNELRAEVNTGILSSHIKHFLIKKIRR